MKRLNVRLPAALLAEIEAEARVREISKAHVVRERLNKAFAPQTKHPPSFKDIADLVGSVDGLPSDLSSRKKMYLTPSYPRRR